MKRKLMALSMVLCLLLSACGQKPVAASESTSDVASASAEASTPAEPESVLADSDIADVPQDAEELGRWLWELNEEKNAENYAVDYDMDMSMRIEVDGESTTEKITTRTRQIKNEDGSLTYQSEEQYLNSVTKLWYDDGMLYLSDPYGDYKAPMDIDAFREQYISDGSSDLLELTADDFGTLTGEETETGYVLNYGDVELNAWMAFSGLLDGILEGMSESCEDFSLNGTVTLDSDGNMLRHEMQLSITLNILGMSFIEEIEMTQSVNSYNENVTVSIPTDDDDFVEMSDLEIPSVFADGFNGTLAQDALNYQDTLTLRVSDAARGMENVYTQQDDITYFFGPNGLSVVWDTNETRDGEMINWRNDSYAGGEGVITDLEGEDPYTYDDDSFSSDLVDFITLYADSFDYGSNFQLTPDGDRTRLTFDVDSDYVSMLLSNYLDSYDTGIDYSEASDETCRGTMSVWLDMAGRMVSQLLDVSAELTYETGVISVTLQDQGDVLAMGDDVALAGGAY